MVNFNNLDYHQLVSIPSEDVKILDKKKIPLHYELEFERQNKLRKILFFIFREGLIRSLRKLKSSFIYKKSLKYQYFILAYSNKTNKYYTGLQISIRQPIFYFLPNNVFAYEPDINKFKDIYQFNPFIGNNLSASESVKSDSIFIPFTFPKPSTIKQRGKSIYLVGGGRYILTEILPVFRDYNSKGICEFNFELLRNKVFEKFELKTNDFEVLFEYAKNDNSEKLFIISSYHSYHTDQALRVLQLSNSKVIIEKPPCITFVDFHLLLKAYDQEKIYIAYHRRFASWNIKIKDILLNISTPLIMTMIIHEVNIPDYHWYFAPNQGTRISGNLCHWIDLAYFWINQKPFNLSITRNTILGVDYSVYNILFENGSLVSFTPSDFGDGTHGVQEYITIKGKNIDIYLSDHLNLSIWRNGGRKKYFRLKRDKGHKRLNRYYSEYVKTGIPSPYSRKDFILSTFTYIKFAEMFNNNIDSFEFDSKYFIDYGI